MNLNDLSTQLLFTTVPIWTETLTGERTSATAFIYNVPVPGKSDQSVPLLITNNHVIANAKRAMIEMVERDGDKPIRDKRVRVELPPELLQQNVSPELDIALIPLGAALNQLQSVGRPAFFRAITPEIIPSSEAVSELAAMEDIVSLVTLRDCVTKRIQILLFVAASLLLPFGTTITAGNLSDRRWCLSWLKRQPCFYSEPRCVCNERWINCWEPNSLPGDDFSIHDSHRYGKSDFPWSR